MIRVLFVCLGNICRSPTATGVFRELVKREGLADRIEVTGAGTGGWHVGEPPDQRTARAALTRGYDLSDLRAQQVTREMIARSQYVLVMDEANLKNVRAIADGKDRDRIRLFLEHAPRLGVREVPDPYYGGPHGFEHVLDLCEEAARALLDTIRREQGLS